MSRQICTAAVTISLVLSGVFKWEDARAQGYEHAYFESLVARGDYWKGWSLRPRAGVTNPSDPYFEKQLGMKSEGGFHVSNCPPATTYSPGADTDPHRQDAAKSPISPFQEPGVCKGHQLTAPMAASVSGANDIVHLTAVTSTYGPPGQRQMMIEQGVLDLRVCSPAEGGDGLKAYIVATGALCVKRGLYGTIGSVHAAGITPKLSTNQINNHLRIPLGTDDGNSYLVTWDTYWTDSYVGLGTSNTGQKTFQFTDAGDNKLWEPKLQFTGGNWVGRLPFLIGRDVGAVDVRSYNQPWDGLSGNWLTSNGNMMGPGFLSVEPVAMTGQFVVRPNIWTRWWVLIDQRANDWDEISMWVADEYTAPVMLNDRVKMWIERKNPPAIGSKIGFFWFEQGDSSTAWLRGDLRDLVSYMRNWVVLRNPIDLPGLLVRPFPSAMPAPPPRAPTRIRVVS